MIALITGIILVIIGGSLAGWELSDHDKEVFISGLKWLTGLIGAIIGIALILYGLTELFGK
jgi:hypothetical protein